MIYKLDKPKYLIKLKEIIINKRRKACNLVSILLDYKNTKIKI